MERRVDEHCAVEAETAGRVREDEGLPNQLYFVDRVPDDNLATVTLQ